jgi:acyl carrier protein
MRSREEILQQLAGILEEMFEVPAEAIVPSAELYDDLDIDSIDAVDLLAKLKELTGMQVDPEQFKAVRTVDDVVTAISELETA